MARTEKIENPQNDKELIQNILYRLETIEHSLKITTDWSDNKPQERMINSKLGNVDLIESMKDGLP